MEVPISYALALGFGLAATLLASHAVIFIFGWNLCAKNHRTGNTPDPITLPASRPTKPHEPVSIEGEPIKDTNRNGGP
ncbi:hypothetical protein KS4_23390 [Poriferisphaera corsica]|uniref:Uncharacterized protein n=1 Tax=Poriferisphaera corsica TaxID=2528020 RepID=A0A517YVQ5_9BACT|nr:hypothetical protein [Poriferisphaera corsica]QDU34272.1 hypothetical protein KS4_23390 [Poriferisphaera corsica]